MLSVKKLHQYKQPKHYRLFVDHAVWIFRGRKLRKEMSRLSMQLANKYFISFVCLPGSGAECYQSFARRLLHFSVWLKSSSSTHNYFLPLKIWQHKFFYEMQSVLFCSSYLWCLTSTPSPFKHNRSANWFPMSPCISLSCHWPIASLCMLSTPSPAL